MRGAVMMGVGVVSGWAFLLMSSFQISWFEYTWLFTSGALLGAGLMIRDVEKGRRI